MSTISQRDARRLKKRVEELEKILEQQRRSWVTDWPGGTHLGNIPCTNIDADVRVSIARKLGHAVVVVNQSKDELAMYALPLAGTS